MLDAVLFLSIFGMLFLALPSFGQGLNLSGSSNCTAADFDANVHFVNAPDDYYSIVIDKRNISRQPCVFDGPTYGPSLVPDRVPGDKPFALCYDCENRLPNGQYRAGRPLDHPLTLDPGEVARQTFRWKTRAPSEAIRCLQLQWMAGPILLVTPSLLKQICSDVEVSRFSKVPHTDSAAQTEAADGASDQAFKLSAGKATYDAGEMFSVRLSSTVTGPMAPPRPDNCPTLYLRERSPDGSTRIDEVQPLAFQGCGRPVLGHQPGDWQSGFELNSGVNTRWMGIGEHALVVFQLAGSLDDPQLRFVSSNVLRVQLADPATIQRKWGTRVKGIAADVTLDKDTFQVGEDIPLHMAIEDFDAKVPVYSWDPVWDPCMVVGIEVQDASGHPLSPSERFPNWSICTGHGFGPRPVEKGKLIPLEQTLGMDGWLPNHPGTYAVVVTWAPCFGPKSAPARGFAADLKAYAVVHATATIRVVGGDGSKSN